MAAGDWLQVEVELFPDMRGQPLLLRSVKVEEMLVVNYIDRAMVIFKANTLGPTRYLNSYRCHADLLNGIAEMETAAFLKEEHSIAGFIKVRVALPGWGSLPLGGGRFIRVELASSGWAGFIKVRVASPGLGWLHHGRPASSWCVSLHLGRLASSG